MKRLGFNHLLHKRLNRMKFNAGWGWEKIRSSYRQQTRSTFGEQKKMKKKWVGLLLTCTGQECARWYCRRSSLSPAVSCRPFPPPLSTPPSCSSSKKFLQLSSWALGTVSACVKSMHPCSESRHALASELHAKSVLPLSLSLALSRTANPKPSRGTLLVPSRRWRLQSTRPDPKLPVSRAFY